MKIMVIGGTGMVGSAVVGELLGRGAQVQVLTRSAERAKNLPKGAEAVVGNLLEPATVRSIFKPVQGVFMLNAVSATETHEGLMALNGARMAQVERMVYLSVHHVEQAAHLPHFGSKLPVERVLKESGIGYTILRPNNFYQNDYRLKEALLEHGVYAQPLGEAGVSRVDVRDIAEAAAIALMEEGHENQTYNLVGPRAWTGQGTAEAWSRALGRPIAYGGNDLEAWERQAAQWMPEWMAFDLRLMYAFFQEKGLLATPADIDRQTRLLGHAPRGFEEFARETAQMWKA